MHEIDAVVQVVANRLTEIAILKSAHLFDHLKKCCYCSLLKRSSTGILATDWLRQNKTK